MEKAIKTLLIEDNPGDARLIRELLSEAKNPPIELEWTDRLSSGLLRAAQGGLDAILLDLSLPDSTGFDTFASLQKHLAQVPVIVLTGLDDEGLALRTVREGAQDYVVKGEVTAQSLARCIRFGIERHKTLAEAAEEPRAEAGKTLAFTGAKGGAGATTVALNVATILAQQGRSVVAIELRPYHGGFALQLRHTPSRNLGDLLELDPLHITPREVKTHLTQLPCGVKALFAPQRAYEFKETQPEQAQALLKAACQLADYVILDVPSTPSAITQTALRDCDSVLLVVERDATCVAAGRAMVDLFKSWEVAEKSLAAVVITSSPMSSFLPLADVQSQLGCGIAGVISPAAEKCAASYRMGVPLVMCEPDCLASANLQELANRVASPVLIPVAS